jgi:hypothetical protein
MRKGVERCSALDVHKAQVTVCVWAPDRRGVRRRAGAAGLDDDRRPAPIARLACDDSIPKRASRSPVTRLAQHKVRGFDT